jgi:hypothetical protein
MGLRGPRTENQMAWLNTEAPVMSAGAAVASRKLMGGKPKPSQTNNMARQ